MRIRLLIITLLALTTMLVNDAAAQERKRDRDIVQFSGIVRDVSTGEPIPFVTVFIDKKFRGTITNLDGFFSFVAQKGDSIVIRSVGYREERLQIPEELSGDSYHVMYGLEADTILLDEVVIYPWPSRQQFRQHFINLEVPEDLQDLARQTFERATLEDFSLLTDYDGNENFDQFVNKYVGEVYYQGQSAPIQLMNPFAWAQFIKAIKEGKFKRKDK